MGFLSLFMMTALLLEAVMDGSGMVNAHVEIGTMIVGGEPVLDCSEFPFLVRLQMTRDPDFSEVCGGAIISDRHILTAAHCVDGYHPWQVTAYLGDYDKTVRDPDEEVMQISAINKHDDYTDRSPDADIAVLTLSSRIQFGRSSCIQKVNMASVFDYDRQYCWAVGWGLLHEHGQDTPNTPMKVDLIVYKMETCKLEFPFLDQYVGMTDRVLCTGDGITPKDTCYGDSGGPIACQDYWNQWELVGTVATGKECAKPGWPSFNANVAAFNNWISNQMRWS